MSTVVKIRRTQDPAQAASASSNPAMPVPRDITSTGTPERSAPTTVVSTVRPAADGVGQGTGRGGPGGDGGGGSGGGGEGGGGGGGGCGGGGGGGGGGEVGRRRPGGSHAVTEGTASADAEVALTQGRAWLARANRGAGFKPRRVGCPEAAPEELMGRPPIPRWRDRRRGWSGLRPRAEHLGRSGGVPGCRGWRRATRALLPASTP